MFCTLIWTSLPLCLSSPPCPHALYGFLQASVAVETMAQAALGSLTPEEVSL